MPVTRRRFDEAVPAAALQLYPDNPNTHPKGQIRALRASIRKLGITRPIICNEKSQILAGNGTFTAGTAEGLETFPVLFLGGLDLAEERAYLVADNQLAALSEWDDDLLRDHVAFLESEGFDMDVLGFSDDELEKLLNPDAAVQETTEDDLPDEPEDAIAEPGDIWLLGPHRLACGFPNQPDTVRRVLNGAKPHLMVTEAPAEDAPFRSACKSFAGDVAYVWVTDENAAQVGVTLRAVKFELRSQIAWGKGRATPSRGHYFQQTEFLWYAVRENGNGHWQGAKKQTTLWKVDQRKNERHKPVACMRRPIENNSKPGEAVYDPFAGAGSTIIAAQQSGRVCLAIDARPAMVELAVARWQAFTGQAATLEADGRPFDEVRKARQAERE